MGFFTSSEIGKNVQNCPIECIRRLHGSLKAYKRYVGDGIGVIRGFFTSSGIGKNVQNYPIECIRRLHGSPREYSGTLGTVSG